MAFTLIELLTVITIIGLLLGIGVGLGGVAIRRSREARLRVEAHQLTTAIEAYRADFNQYPPDNAVDGTNANPAVNQLYYELGGAYALGKGRNYRAADRTELVPDTLLKTLFHADGIVNSVELPEGAALGSVPKPKNHLSGVKIARVALRTKPDIELLVTPLRWVNKTGLTPPAPLTGFTTDAKLLAVNPWRYVSTHPTNNPAGFDIWTQVLIGNRVRTFGNWKE